MIMMNFTWYFIFN